MLLASQRLAAWATDGPLANASVAVLLADLALADDKEAVGDLMQSCGGLLTARDGGDSHSRAGFCASP
jgi:hypothetical protein